jgi:ADP-L-glycero-D-manno-heptose 6-epimerase
MIVVTGGAGFIGSAIVWRLNRESMDDILVVDEDPASPKWRNLEPLRYAASMDKSEFIRRVRADELPALDAVIHMGACSATSEKNREFLRENNFHYTRDLALWSLEHGARFVYASSGATYGNGSRAFSDADEVTPRLQPLNPYGESKQQMDLWALEEGVLDRVAGLKFFNVFGPNEYHKGEMSSFIFKAFHQIRNEGRVRLFRSHRPDYRDGEQQRDFVYVKDCVDVVWWLLQNPSVNGLYNVGTGEARSWLDLVRAISTALDRQPEIDWVDIPEVIREGYQYHTQAEMGKLRAAGYTAPFQALEESVVDYVRSYLASADPYLRIT